MCNKSSSSYKSQKSAGPFNLQFDIVESQAELQDTEEVYQKAAFIVLTQTQQTHV
jgi:hypothetical protein